MRSVFLYCVLVLLSPILFAQEALNNDSVLKLVKAGLSPDLIIATINASPGKYDTSAGALIALKKAGASDKVVAAMILKESGATAPGAPAAGPATAPATPDASGDRVVLSPGALPAGVDSVGIYFFDKAANAWQEVPAEVVNFKSGGALKHFASAGVLKGEMNGLVGGNRSPLSLRAPVSILLYVPEGRSPGEYQLLHLHPNADSREFRAANGGIVHDSGGALRDVVDYTPKKVAPRMYLVDLGDDFDRGEYGFLPPSDAAMGDKIPTATKIYSFSLIQ